MNEVIKTGEYYRHWDKSNNRWVQHRFVTDATCVKTSDDSNVQAKIDSLTARINALEAKVN